MLSRCACVWLAASSRSRTAWSRALPAVGQMHMSSKQRQGKPLSDEERQALLSMLSEQQSKEEEYQSGSGGEQKEQSKKIFGRFVVPPLVALLLASILKGQVERHWPATSARIIKPEDSEVWDDREFKENALVYHYSVHGVEYEHVQEPSWLQEKLGMACGNDDAYAPGRIARVNFNPKYPAMSVVNPPFFYTVRLRYKYAPKVGVVVRAPPPPEGFFEAMMEDELPHE